MAEPGHPDWCAQGHRCGLGEHRSEPVTVHGVTLVRVGTGRREWVEFRGAMSLERGGDQAAQLLVALDLAVRAVLAGRTEDLAELMAAAGPYPAQ